MKKVSQHRKMSVDSGVGGQSSASSNASINNASCSASSGIITPKGDANSTTGLINLNGNPACKAGLLEKGINDIRITENPISESPEHAAAAENPVC